MRILIWDKGLPLTNTGGPNGYLYNIKSFLSKNPNDIISFYSDVVEENKIDVSHKDCSRKKSIIEHMLSYNVLNFLYTLYSIYFKKVQLSGQEMELVNQFDFVHIHTFNQFMTTFADHKGLKAKIVLTTHCPEPCFDETCGNFHYTKLFRLLSPIRNYFIRKECNELKKTDYILLPVEEAKEAYTSASIYYERLFDNIGDKFIYVATSIYPSNKILASNNPLAEIPFNKDDLKVCFIGRHNTIKGYDQLKEIAKKTIEEDLNVHFFIGGKEFPLKGLDNKNWTELGWVNTIDVLNNVDVFILPNKQTYFDLILLEVLRQGNVCVISRTGGNKWFSRFSESGIFLYNYGDNDEVVNILKKLLILKKQNKLKDLELKNRLLFETYLTADVFVRRFVDELEKIKKT